MVSDSSGSTAVDGHSTTRAGVAGLDAVALKPTEHDLSRATDLGVGTLAIDYEGRESLPDPATLRTLAADREVVVTTPVRADGFDPLGDDSLLRDWLPGGVTRAVVAGHPAYLTEEERGRSVAPRFGATLDGIEDAWVGTEGVERVALATGHTQYELLSRDTGGQIRALRDAGFTGEIAVYAPTVRSGDEDAILDAVGPYAARRDPVRRALPDDAATDAAAEGRAREVLTAAVEDYALVGSPDRIRERVADLRAAGVDAVVGYPARGLDRFVDP